MSKGPPLYLRIASILTTMTQHNTYARQTHLFNDQFRHFDMKLVWRETCPPKVLTTKGFDLMTKDYKNEFPTTMNTGWRREGSDQSWDGTERCWEGWIRRRVAGRPERGWDGVDDLQAPFFRTKYGKIVHCALAHLLIDPNVRFGHTRCFIRDSEEQALCRGAEEDYRQFGSLYDEDPASSQVSRLLLLNS